MPFKVTLKVPFITIWLGPYLVHLDETHKSCKPFYIKEIKMFCPIILSLVFILTMHAFAYCVKKHSSTNCE